MKVALRNKATGQVRFQKIGWSWTCFFFSGLLGIPLFWRGLNTWGSLMVVIWIVNIFASILPPSQQIMAVAVLALLGIGFAIFFGAKANALAGRRYLENGWEFADPNSAETARARLKWGLWLPAQTTAAQT